MMILLIISSVVRSNDAFRVFSTTFDLNERPFSRQIHLRRFEIAHIFMWDWATMRHARIYGALDNLANLIGMHLTIPNGAATANISSVSSRSKCVIFLTDILQSFFHLLIMKFHTCVLLRNRVFEMNNSGESFLIRNLIIYLLFQLINSIGFIFAPIQLIKYCDEMHLSRCTNPAHYLRHFIGYAFCFSV